MPKGRIDVEIYFDADGNRTCASNFKDGSFCKFYRTQRYGTIETCAFAHKQNKYADQLQRRGENGIGSLIPGDWCPIVNE